MSEITIYCLFYAWNKYRKMLLLKWLLDKGVIKMAGKRFTNIEHDYENAWIKCNDNGDFMIYAIYKELDESLPSLEDLLNGLNDEKEQLKQEYNSLRRTAYRIDRIAHEDREYSERLYKQNQQLEKENEQLKQDIENLKTTLVARETLIDVCEKKFRELGYIITVDDDGYVIE